MIKARRLGMVCTTVRCIGEVPLAEGAGGVRVTRVGSEQLGEGCFVQRERWGLVALNLAADGGSGTVTPGEQGGTSGGTNRVHPGFFEDESFSAKREQVGHAGRRVPVARADIDAEVVSDHEQ